MCADDLSIVDVYCCRCGHAGLQSWKSWPSSDGREFFDFQEHLYREFSASSFLSAFIWLGPGNPCVPISSVSSSLIVEATQSIGASPEARRSFTHRTQKLLTQPPRSRKVSRTVECVAEKRANSFAHASRCGSVACTLRVCCRTVDTDAFFVCKCNEYLL